MTKTLQRAARPSAATRLKAYTSISTFDKSDPRTVAFTLTKDRLILKGGTYIAGADSIFKFTNDTPVELPKMGPGADYAIYLCKDGKLRADVNFTAPKGFTRSTSRQIGGFHFAPGGNATAQSGGDDKPAINPYSLWDIKFRPACRDPRGMALVQDHFWCDIHLCNNTPENGTSRFNETIADYSSPPTIPVSCGGDGTKKYTSFNWWEAAEVLSAAGKQLLSYDEFAAAAFGTTEGTSANSDPKCTILRPEFTSRWGIMLVTGNMWTWGREFSHWPNEKNSGWKDVTQHRGKIFLPSDTSLVAAIFGGLWGDGGYAGSRSSFWVLYPWYSYNNIGARGRCDHLIHV